MEIREIKNSSGKKTGIIEIYENEIIIKNDTKSIFIINDINIIKEIKNNNLQIIQFLYDEYTLTIGEIASLFNKCYSNINKILKTYNLKTNKKSGRRNSSYGKVFDEARIKNMVNNRKDDHKQRLGTKISEEQKRKISNTLKKKYKNKEISTNSEKMKTLWKKGCYDNTDFGYGIGGHFTSIKNNKRIFFRSLLELYFLIKLELDEKIYSYEYEPIKIICDNGSIYIPNFLVQNTIIELKSKKYIEKMPLEIKNKLLYKKEQAEKYCQKNGLNYKVIFDEDIEFETKKMKAYLKSNPSLINKFQITFISPKRVFS